MPKSLKNKATMDFNDSVWVKVTPHGKQFRKSYYKRLGIKAPALERYAGGWTRMQLHEIAHLFGSEMYSSNPYCPIETTFLIEVPKK